MRKVNKAYKFRLYPNAAQQHFFWETFSATRFVWNKMLYDRIEHFKETGKSTTVYPTRYKDEHPWLKAVDSLALSNVQLQISAAYREFFKVKKHSYTQKTIERAKRQNRTLTFYNYEKHPKFKSKKRNDWKSYTTNNQNETILVTDRCIKLPKVGLVRCKFHRQIPSDAIIKSATVSQMPTGKYYVSVLVNIENNIHPVEPKTFIGLDFSMKELYVDSFGNAANYPHFYRQAEVRLAQAQRRLASMEKSSSNYKKQRLRVAALHEKIANQRKDFLHKQSNLITKNYDAVCIEDLNMKGMAQALNFGKSVSDNGWGMFTRFLEYKLSWSGRYLVKVNKWFPSSKLCSVCGTVHDSLALSDRTWTCEGCGTHHDRDINAAINIRNEGMEMLAA